MGRQNCEFDSLCHGMSAYSSTKNLLVLNVGNGWVAGGMGLLSSLIVDHSLLPY